MKRIVLAGGTGNLGTLLISAFSKLGYQLVVLSRQKEDLSDDMIQYIQWDGKSLGNWINALENADALINLSGLSINRRFNKKNKQLLLSSRVEPTKVLAKALSALMSPPRLWINFSGVSIFNGADNLQDEHSVAYGHDFLAELTRIWENTFLEYDIPHVQKVVLRISPVLNKQSGLFKELYPLVKIGLGGTVGSGKQYMPWIHEEDFIRLVIWILQQEQPLPIYHACSPFPLPNKEFMSIFRKEANQAIGLPLPTVLAKIGSFLKGVDASLLLASAPVTTILTTENGFKFNFPYLHAAIKQLINH